MAQIATNAMLVDLDPWGGGIDLLVGAETAPGVRWPDLTLQGGRLNWSALREALPRHRGITVLSGTRQDCEFDADAVHSVVDAGRRGGVTVVCDLPRRLNEATETALETADLVVVISPCDVRACAATATITPVLAATNPNLGLVVRGPSPGGLRADEVAAIAGVPLLASMKPHPRLAAGCCLCCLRIWRTAPKVLRHDRFAHRSGAGAAGYGVRSVASQGGGRCDQS
jgi:secretion/DNA translocation related CpaE-like protein